MTERVLERHYRTYAAVFSLFALCTLASSLAGTSFVTIETDVTRSLLSWASPSSCWVSQRLYITLFFSVFSSLLALCLLANSEIWKQTESEQNSARSLHDCVGIRGNDTILDDILPSPTTTAASDAYLF